MMTMIVGTRLFPSPLDAAIVQSMNADTQYENAITRSLSMPSAATSGSFVKSIRNSLPKNARQTPITSAEPNEYARLTK